MEPEPAPGRRTVREGPSLSRADDLQSVRRVRAGETEAFAGLVERWQRPLLNLAYRFCRDRGKAEEMVQEAFLRAFRKLHLFDERSSFSSWLFTLATRVFVSEMRRYHPGWLEDEAVNLLRSSSDPEAETNERERAETVRRAVLALPEKYRSAVTVYYFHEMDVTQAAASLGLSPGTLKSRLHRGRALLERRVAGRLKLSLVSAES